MHLRVACDTDTEEISVFLFDVANQVDCIVKAIFLCDPICGTSRWVSPQSKQVLDAQVTSLVEACLDLFSVHEGAGDVHEHVKT